MSKTTERVQCFVVSSTCTCRALSRTAGPKPSGPRSTMLLIHLRAPERFASTFRKNLQTELKVHTKSLQPLLHRNSLCPFLLAALAALGRGAASRAGCHEVLGSAPCAFSRFSTQNTPHTTPSVVRTVPDTTNCSHTPRRKVQVPQGPCERSCRDWMWNKKAQSSEMSVAPSRTCTEELHCT